MQSGIYVDHPNLTKRNVKFGNMALIDHLGNEDRKKISWNTHKENFYQNKFPS